MECGCGCVWRVKNLAYVMSSDGCAHCLDMVRNPDDCSPLDHSGMVAAEAGWCGCGALERVDRMMLAYLSQDDTILRDDHVEEVSDDASVLLAYIADSLGWTEHGGGVGGSWLTDDGKEALANLRHLVTIPHL